ncbi:MAG TPA: response regulator [Methylomirabilota bacterium]|jgi:CheY-like chemotaxis protein
MRIVVVDDEQPIMQFCVNVLERGGHSVEGFTRPEDALTKLAAQPADLLLVDYKMPGLTGFEVIRRARQLQPALAAMMITGHGTRDVLEEATRTPVNGLLLKPFTVDELSRAVATVLQGRPLSPPRV